MKMIHVLRSCRCPLLRAAASSLCGRPGALNAAVCSKGRSYLVVVALFFAVTLTGCVRRTITITTEPPAALVFLNDQEVGRSAVTIDFLWYGDYDVIIRKEGYQALKTNWEIKPPWYQIIPFDFIAEVLWPGHLHDKHARHFTLEPAELPTQEELVKRAEEIRQRALSPRK